VVFRIHDNGIGFDTSAAVDGHGLASMRARAEKLHGAFAIQSAEGRGTLLEARIPL
jgi:signal transduction histidine kinase